MKKMKRVANNLKGKKAVILMAAFMLCISAGIVALSQYAKAATVNNKSEIPAEVMIAGTTYTKDRPYKIIEVVPSGAYAQGSWGWSVGGTSMPISIEDLDYLYHKVGGASYTCAFADGEHNDQGVCKFTGAFAPDAGEQKLKQVQEAMRDQIAQTYIASFAPNDYQITGNNVPGATGGWFGDYYYHTGSNWNDPYVKVKDRDFLAHALFENKTIEDAVDYFSDMSDKLQVQIVESNQLTKDIIDSADMVYLNPKVHNANVTAANNKFVELCNANGIGAGGVTAGLTRDYVTTTQKTGLDFNDTIALYLFMQSATNDLPLAIDWSAANLSGNTGFDKLCCVALGIETDTFVAEYAYKKVDENSYAGNNGRTFIDASGTWVIEQAEVNWYGTITNNKILDWCADMFIQSHGNVAAYPYFNAGTSGSDVMHKNIYAYYGDNALDMKLIYGTSSMTANERNDAADAKDIFKTDDLTIRNCMQYIMGLFGNGEKEDIVVAEVQPWGKYQYNSEEGARKIIKSFGILNNIVKMEGDSYTEGNYTVYPLRTYIVVAGIERPDKLYNVKIRSMSMNAFNGITEDLAATYDLIILDSYNPDGYISLSSKAGSSGHVYEGSINVNSSGKTERTMSGNDLTDKMAERLYDYVAMGMPIFMSREIYYGDTDTVSVSASNVGSFCWTKLNKKLRNEGKVTYNIATVGGVSTGSEPSAADFKSSTILMLPDRVLFEILTPQPYSESSPNLIDPANVRFTIDLYTDLPKGSRIQLYIDRNADALYNDDETTVLRELYNDYTVSEDISSAQNVEIPIKGSSGGLPTNWFGYFKFKIQITTPDGKPYCQESAFALNPNKERVVNVLQVYKNASGIDTATQPDRAYAESTHLNLINGAFAEAFDAVYNVTKMKLNVEPMDTEEFVRRVKDDPGFLSEYNIIVMGFQDNYGKIKHDGVSTSVDSIIKDTDVLDALQDYVENNKSILFTHDSLSYEYSSGSDKLSETELTQALSEPIGMQGAGMLTNSLYTKLGFMSTFKSIGYSSSSDRSTKMTDSVDKLNWGQITEYPYTIDNSITVKGTHGQYYRLNLEKQDTRDSETGAVMPGVYNSYVTTWFTLGNGENSHPQAGSNGSDEENDYFSLTGQDAMNNYYIYSKGNVTYTSAGHSVVELMDSSGTKLTDNTDEIRLFVNTLIRSIIVSTDNPKVEVTNGVELSDTEYEIIARSKKINVTYDASGNPVASEDDLNTIPLSFKVTGDDLVDGVTPLQRVIVYLDYDNNGKYDAADPVTNPYGDAVLQVYMNPAPVIAGTEIVITDLKALAAEYMIAPKDNGVAYNVVDELNTRFVNNQLKIGIQARLVTGSKGTSSATYVRRDYFELK